MSEFQRQAHWWFRRRRYLEALHAALREMGWSLQTSLGGEKP